MQVSKKQQRLAWLSQQVGKRMENNPSPFAHWLDGALLEVGEGYTKASFTVRKDMTNPMGIMHGGVTAGIIDEVMGVTTFGLGLDFFYPTIDLQVSYFAPAREGEEVIVEAQVLKKGRTIIHLEATMKNVEGRLLAKSNSNIAKSDIPIPA
jgi:acyl-coenzyme A thioesterase 13